MRKRLGISAILLFLLSGLAAGQDKPAVVIRAEPGFPAADSAVASPQPLASWVQGAPLASVEQLGQLLNAPASAALLVLACGQPFTRAAYRDYGSWKLREYSVR